MADIFDEVSEELKQDQLKQIWNKYSKYIISVAFILFISVLGYFFYDKWRLEKIEVSSSQFFSGIEKLEKKEFLSSIEIFSKNVDQAHQGYKTLSLFGIAEANFKIGKVDEMILNYKSIYENQNIDVYYRDLARLLSVMKDNVSSFEIQKKILDPILNSPSKLQLLAAELEIMLLIRFNKIDEAKLSISKLLKRTDITFEQKNRLDLIDKVYNSNAK
ncbi:hypothetical protein N9O66_00445 [Alphaproteobacteria bacterium]|jgi:hypothetical protein|nr:hypothetical protein [Alphaproteobacteria bacterium]MDA9914645.1 hypothetical protein [Alphaproteobacteria bacterium]